MAIQEVKIPDIGGFDTVEVIEVLVDAGATVTKGKALITLRSYKATLEVPSTAGGIVVQLPLAESANVAAGDVIAFVDAVAIDETTAPANQALVPALDKIENKSAAC